MAKQWDARVVVLIRKRLNGDVLKSQTLHPTMKISPTPNFKRCYKRENHPSHCQTLSPKCVGLCPSIVIPPNMTLKFQCQKISSSVIRTTHQWPKNNIKEEPLIILLKSPIRATVKRNSNLLSSLVSNRHLYISLYSLWVFNVHRTLRFPTSNKSVTIKKRIIIASKKRTFPMLTRRKKN